MKTPIRQAPAPGPRAAPPPTSGRPPQKAYQPNGQLGRSRRVNGICRWCYELTASTSSTRWHLYCLNAYRVASGQHPDEIQRTLCEICGDPPDEIDHRLAIEVARALGPAAMLRAFTLDNLRWLCRSCHRRKTRQDRRLAKFLVACSLDWYGAKRMLRQNHRWALSFLMPCSLEPSPRQSGARLN